MFDPGHILDDQDLVDTLDKSKKMSGEIEKRVIESEDTQKKIEQARKKYLPVSTYLSCKFYILCIFTHTFTCEWDSSMEKTCIPSAQTIFTTR